MLGYVADDGHQDAPKQFDSSEIYPLICLACPTKGDLVPQQQGLMLVITITMNDNKKSADGIQFPPAFGFQL
jgi:hypothetical protein